MQFLKNPGSLCLLVAWIGCAQADLETNLVSFESDGLVISGTLLGPSGNGPHPGVVMIGGSGPSDRESLLDHAEILASLGLAVLIYDKRGTGHSGGSWITSSLDDLAGDAVAAFEYLAKQPETDPQRLGYWGISQGGWIAPLAAGQTQAAFLIAVTGGGLKPRETETYGYLSTVRHYDNSPQAEAQCRQLLEEYFSYLSGEISREALDSRMDAFRDTPWLAPLGIERVIPGETNRSNWQWVAKFEPGKSINTLKMPVLVLLGGADRLAPAVPSSEAWIAALPPTNGSRVVIVPGAAHGLRTGRHGGPLRPEVDDLQQGWLNEMGILEKKQ